MDPCQGLQLAATLGTMPMLAKRVEGTMPVLLVEDNPTIALIIRRLALKAARAEVEVANTASEALTLVHRNSYSLLVVDQILPGGMTGLQFIKAVRMVDRYQSIPILMVSGDHEPSLKTGADQLGVFRLLRKPIDTTEFRWAVQTCLGIDGDPELHAYSA